MTELSAPLTVRFDRCEAGWINFRVTSGPDTLELQASHIYDPLPALLAWLEAITFELPRCGWTLDEEGALVAFDVAEAEPAESLVRKPTSMRLTVTPDYAAPPLTCTLGRRSLVRTFYQAVREFVNSDRYRPGEWERQSLGDRVAEKTGLDPDHWIDELLTTALSRRELQKRFWQIHGGTLTGDWAHPDMIGTLDEYTEMTGGEQPLPHGARPHYWSLEEWDSLPDREARRAYLLACLKDDDDSSWCGLPWPRMRSPRIENWLKRDDRDAPQDWTHWLTARAAAPRGRE